MVQISEKQTHIQTLVIDTLNGIMVADEMRRAKEKGYDKWTDLAVSVYDIVDIIKSSKQFKIKEEKDYIKNPKTTGYMSYHLIVLVPIYLNETVEHVEAEIQIRTSAMDFWASIDHKVQYKFPSEIPEEVKKEMYNCSLDIRKLDEKMQQLNEFVNKYNKE